MKQSWLCTGYQRSIRHLGAPRSWKSTSKSSCQSLRPTSHRSRRSYRNGLFTKKGDLALARIFLFTCQHCNARVSRASGNQAARVYRRSADPGCERRGDALRRDRRQARGCDRSRAGRLSSRPLIESTVQAALAAALQALLQRRPRTSSR
jgi:hypothetical protein